MTQELVSLTIIMAVAAVSPIVAQLIPGKFIPQTVLLLAAGTALGPYGLGVIEVNDAVKGSMSFYYPWKMAGLFCLKVGPLFSLKGMGLSFEGFNEGVNGKSPI